MYWLQFQFKINILNDSWRHRSNKRCLIKRNFPNIVSISFNVSSNGKGKLLFHIHKYFVMLIWFLQVLFHLFLLQTCMCWILNSTFLTQSKKKSYHVVKFIRYWKCPHEMLPGAGHTQLSPLHTESWFLCNNQSSL